MNCSGSSAPTTTSPGHGRSGGLGALVELLDPGGELEVALGQATLVVAGQGQGDLVPADVDVGVVAGRLGRAGDLVDEGHRLGEVGACEGLDDLVAAPLPAGQVLQAFGDGGVVQPWHGLLLPGECDCAPSPAS